jgi:putative FmdB family regulatory protein
MPIYEYRCSNGHVFEVFRSISDEPLSECEECGAPVERVFHPVAVHYKGSGFYTTDYAKKGAGKAGGSSEKKESSGDGSSESKKPETKSEGKSSGGSKDD